MTYTVALAGSTQRTQMCAQTLLAHPNYSIPWVLTPAPKPVGRTQALTPNPLHMFAQEHGIPSILVERTIDANIHDQITSVKYVQPDFLLVVDFGFLVPNWLLQLPTHSPLNIHPSLLPRWRGSSPGQFVLMAGEKTSAVTLMIMNAKLDEGPIISQLEFATQPNWTQTEYYAHSFKLICSVLPEHIAQFAQGKLPPQPQPFASPTPIAKRLKRDDGYIAWDALRHSMLHPTPPAEITHEEGVLHEIWQYLCTQPTSPTYPEFITQACRGLSPWPGIWSVVPTTKGEKRMKILNCHVLNETLQLETVQLEGKHITSWNDTKYIIHQ